jgi:hypothetical protein
MCTGIEIAALAAAAALSAGGAAVSQHEATSNANNVAMARNRALQATLDRTRGMSKDSRAVFDKRAEEIAPAKLAKTQEDVTANRTAGLTDAVDKATPADVPLAGSAPAVVKSEVASRMKDAMESGINRAKALGKLGGYGDLWSQEGFANQDASRNIDVQQNLISGQMSMLPYQQQLAELRATRAPSLWGPVLQGAGSVIGSAAGAGMLPGGSVAKAGAGGLGLLDWSKLPVGGTLVGSPFGAG